MERGESRDTLLVLKLVSEILECYFLNLKLGGLTDSDREVAFIKVTRRVTTRFAEPSACSSVLPGSGLMLSALVEYRFRGDEDFLRTLPLNYLNLTW